MIDETSVTIGFPGVGTMKAGELATSLLSVLKQDTALRKHLDRDRTRIARTDPEAHDFGATLIAVLGTQAVIILAQAIKSWAERTGTTSIEWDGVRIDNVRSQDAAAIAAAVKGAPVKGKTGTQHR